MSMMISEMYHPPLSDPTQRASADPSDIGEIFVPSDNLEGEGLLNWSSVCVCLQ